MNQDVEYNGTLASSLGILVKDEISIPSPERKYQEYKIPGRDGALIDSDGTYGDINIKIAFNYAETGDWGEKYANAKKWLYGDGSRVLKLKKTSQNFYKVKRIEVGSEQRMNIHSANFEATFVCDPYTYLESGLNKISSGNINNPGETAHPIYHITGDGQCTITVNGKTMTATVGQNLTIDTDLMIAYRTDGTTMNTSVSGDYEDLYLTPGSNSIGITSGFTLKLTPNWRRI